MPKLLRQLNKNLWASCLDSADWANAQCPSKLVSEFMEGASVWEIDDDIPVERIIAAIALSQKNVSDVQYVEIDQDKLKAFGIGLKMDSGTTCDAEVNKKHRSLINITPDRISPFACEVKQCSAQTIASQSILETSAKYFKSKLFDPLKFAKDQRKKAGVIIESFFERQLLEFKG